MRRIFSPTVHLAISLVWFLIALYLIFLYAPQEMTMGEVQRIFYIHVPSGWTAGTAYLILFVASVLYLWKRSPRADDVAQAAGEVGFVFCSCLIVTGPLWAKPVWGIWWTWDARLTSTLVLWLIYVSYLILRRYATGGQTATLAAVLAIFGFLDVPLVYMAIRWFRTQHPQPVIGGGEGSGIDPHMLHALMWNWLAFMVFAGLIGFLRYRLEVLSRLVDAEHARRALSDDAYAGGAR